MRFVAVHLGLKSRKIEITREVCLNSTEMPKLLWKGTAVLWVHIAKSHPQRHYFLRLSSKNVLWENHKRPVAIRLNAWCGIRILQKTVRAKKYDLQIKKNDLSVSAQQGSDTTPNYLKIFTSEHRKTIKNINRSASASLAYNFFWI